MNLNKLFLGFILAFAVVILSGCDTQELVQKEQLLRCNASQDGVDVGFNVSFKGNKVTNMNLIYEMSLDGFTDDRIEAAKDEDYCKIVKESLSDYESAFKDCNQKIEDKKLLVTSNLDINKMDDSKSNSFTSITQAKKGLEEVGYTCTIE